MKNENIQFERHEELRKELDSKIDKKVSEVTFWSVIGFIVLFLVGISAWLMNINQRITCTETKVEMMQSATIQQIPISTPLRK